MSTRRYVCLDFLQRTTRVFGAACVSALLFASFFLGGCDNSPAVMRVRDGVLPNDPSITVGKAFSSYPWFKSVTWSESTDSKDRTLVQADAEFDIASVLNTAPVIDGAEGAAAAMLIGSAKKISPAAISVRYVITFALNKDGSGFAPYSAEFRIASKDEGYKNAIDTLPGIHDGVLKDSDFDGLSMIYQGSVARVQVILGTIALAAKFL